MINSQNKKGIVADALASMNQQSNQNPNEPLGLSSLWSRPEVSGLYYNGKAIKVDGYKFINCRFDNCSLYVNSDNFEFINCVIDDSTTVQYSNNLIKVIRLFLRRFEWANLHWPGFTPTKNPDGTVTISDRGY